MRPTAPLSTCHVHIHRPHGPPGADGPQGNPTEPGRGRARQEREKHHRPTVGKHTWGMAQPLSRSVCCLEHRHPADREVGVPTSASPSKLFPHFPYGEAEAQGPTARNRAQKSHADTPRPCRKWPLGKSSPAWPDRIVGTVKVSSGPSCLQNPALFLPVRSQGRESRHPLWGSQQHPHVRCPVS